MNVIFNKGNEKIKDIVNIFIQDAKGISLFGNQVVEKEMKHEV